MTTTALADHQRALAQALSDPADDTRGLPVSRWAVRRWAHAQLRAVCPLTTSLLELRGELDDVVADHLARGNRPASVHRWGRSLLAALSEDGQVDRTTADLALFELASLAPPAEHPVLPDPWVWARHPVEVSLAVLAGIDPDVLPLAPTPFLLHRGADGRLVADPT